MKTYRLIKTYPGLPPNVAKAVLSSSGNYRLLTEEGISLSVRNIGEIENFPEFWQENTPFILITKDGITICDSRQVVYGYNIISKEQGASDAGRVWAPPTNWAYFSTIEARQAYIDSLKPEPLFISIDGVPIYPDTTFWVVFPDYSIKETRFSPKDILLQEVKPFSNRENAVEWVLQNKPLISLKDIMRMRSSYYLPDSAIRKFKALAESHLIQS